MDLISGSWPGEIFFFKGGPDHNFAAPEMIEDKDGNIINIGGGIQEKSNQILITGNAKFEQTEEGTFVYYRGRKIENTPEKPIGITGSASAVSVADWDGDGDFDLIVGTIRGKVYLIPNEGTAESFAFGKEQQIASVSSRAGPYAADWEGDGDLDLLVGADDGSVSLFSNTGSSNSPELASAVQLVPPGRSMDRSRVSKEVARGSRSKICVTDWNGDGLLDLLVGDFCLQKPDLPEPTAEEKAEYDRIRKELEPIQQRFGELIQKLDGPSRVKTKEEMEKIQKEIKEVREKMTELSSKLPDEYERHGWVWLFLRNKN
ncbi:MAG: VCBS repeat-containing protein [Sedimentisphaerales bacterium]|nr:VCBS repeat-containing protein [Sedimentisphaerales bacterium]